MKLSKLWRLAKAIYPAVKDIVRAVKGSRR